MENFSGRVAHTIYQDFHAAVLMGNLVSLLSMPARDAFANEQREGRLQRRLNWTQALGKMKDTTIRLFTRGRVGELIEQLVDLFLVTWEVFRPDRRFPRNHRINKRIYHMAYKPAH